MLSDPHISSSYPSENFTSSTLLALLNDFDDNSICAPNYIQPNGILIALTELDLTIAQISDNIELFLGVPPELIVGKPLSILFPNSQIKLIREVLAQNKLDQINPFELKIRRPNQILSQTGGSEHTTSSASRKSTAYRFRSTLHQTRDRIILELEPECQKDTQHSLHFHNRLQTAILALRETETFLDLAHTLAETIQLITGFDRVMVYRFEADDHGVVIAEAKESSLESFLGLHYPATDIPVTARRLFLRNWVRQIPDVNAIPAHLISSSDISPNPPLDLSPCILRGVSPYHIEYLQNMGVAGSCTISLVNDQQLWGLIACHHYTPRLLDYETRKICEFLGQIASIELVRQQTSELQYYQQQVKAIQDTLQQSFSREPTMIQQVLTRNGEALLDLVHASGVAIVLDQDISLVGQTPSLSQVNAILAGVLQQDNREFYWTDCLKNLCPEVEEFQEVASGLLAISVVLQQKSYHLLWFRPEQVQTVNWAGKPQDSLTIDELGQMQLCPRKSFELWKETVRGRSLPWQRAELEAAKMMWNTLMLAVLEFSQLALKQIAERAAIANRAKSQFLAKMSHELRTPLNAILGFTQVMNRDTNTPVEFQEHLGIINRSGEHLLGLINDVLEMSRIEAGQLVLSNHYFNLHRLIQSVQELFVLKASQCGLTIIFHQEPTLPRYVCGDEGKLRQILINLIGNAIKFTHQGSVTVRITSLPREVSLPSGCTCHINLQGVCQDVLLSFEVEDTGCGIERQEWETIFEAFIQTEQGRHAQGTGLGLSISRQFARLMGGDITVRSLVGKGSTFTCTVAVRYPNDADVTEEDRTQQIAGLALGEPPCRILVVEDVPENQLLLSALLEPVGFEVQTAENGQQAIALWQTWHPHLILMDVQMPVMDGYEATQAIRAIEQAQREAAVATTTSLPPGEMVIPSPIKIIALTAHAFENDRIDSLTHGCDDHIAKPFTESILLEAIARHLGIRYRYAEPIVPTPPPRESHPLTPADLQAVMSADWIERVHEAALDLDDYTIYQLIEQIPPQADDLICGLKLLIDNFQLDAIATLTQPKATSP